MEHAPSKNFEFPEYTSDMALTDTDIYVASFPKGEERQERQSEIINEADALLPKWMNQEEIAAKHDLIRLVAITGSSAYGPRERNSSLADIDVAFLLDKDNDEDNFEIFPEKSDEEPFHLLGTGKNDVSRGNRTLHWLLYPHIPIRNELSDEELRSIVGNLVESTRQRIAEIQNVINDFKTKTTVLSKESRHVWHK